jgi:hypothetical protein
MSHSQINDKVSAMEKELAELKEIVQNRLPEDWKPEVDRLLAECRERLDSLESKVTEILSMPPEEAHPRPRAKRITRVPRTYKDYVTLHDLCNAGASVSEAAELMGIPYSTASTYKNASQEQVAALKAREEQGDRKKQEKLDALQRKSELRGAKRQERLEELSRREEARSLKKQEKLRLMQQKEELKEQKRQEKLKKRLLKDEEKYAKREELLKRLERQKQLLEMKIQSGAQKLKKPGEEAEAPETDSE